MIVPDLPLIALKH